MQEIIITTSISANRIVLHFEIQILGKCSLLIGILIFDSW